MVARLQERWRGAHHVLITGYASEEAAVAALGLRVDDYIRKPFDINAFLERIRAVCRQRLQRRQRLERRRTLARYGLEAGERLFRVQLSSERLKLNGTLDLLIRTDREDVPVEFKYTLGDVMSHHKYQLAAYALLVEEHFGRPVRRGVLAILPANRIRWIAVTEGVRRYVNRLLREIRASIARQLMAPPVRRCGRCRDCEFRYYCHDIY